MSATKLRRGERSGSIDGVTAAVQVSVSDDAVILRPWSPEDAWFMAAASADPAIRRYNGDHDRRGHRAPPLSPAQAESAIDRFALAWQEFDATGTPTGRRVRGHGREIW